MTETCEKCGITFDEVYRPTDVDCVAETGVCTACDSKDRQMSVKQDRDHVYVQGSAVLHSVARRDWVCSTCGGKLATRFYEDAPNWRTVCVADAHHDPDKFVHRATWEYLQAKQQAESIEAG